MELFDISWPNTPVQCNGVCQGNEFVEVEEMKKSAESGCPKCFLMEKTALRYRTTERSIKFNNDTPGTITLIFRPRSDLEDIFRVSRLFYLSGTPKPAWDFIRPGNLFLKNRRDEYRPLLAGWLEDCNSNHKDCVVSDSLLPKRVLDVGTKTAKQLFLHISSDKVAPYVALSHCWGATGIQLKTTTSTLQDHQKGINFQDLPMNFQDAVTITRGIGIRYLWIDSLCIVQDDIDDWQVESSKMASIYRDAYLVLAATQASDSCQGFLDRRDPEDGVGYSPPPLTDAPVHTGQIRNPDSTVSKIYVQDLNPRWPFVRHHNTATYSPLNYRAWALQENILPRRIVHFTSNELLWECINSLKCECMEVDEAPKQEKTVNLVRGAHFFRFSKHYYSGSVTLHRTWIGLLEAFCPLKLSYESDRLPALSGLAHLWKSRGAGVYLAGLWQDDIVDSLIWIRFDTFKQIHPWKDYRAPSWSPFALGYTLENQKPVSAKFEFPVDYQSMSTKYAKVVDSCCVPDGKDEMGAVKDGYIILRTLVAEVYPEDPTSILLLKYECDWDRGREEAEGQVITLILLGSYEFSPDLEGREHISPRAIVTIPSRRHPGAYERIGILTPHYGERADRIYQCLKDGEEREIKIV
ncbi:het-domain-containing protein [Fusarium napiforme]|uniref:Het-domain-containing protein n=1 Tax=Fusarium napiforme TaxID=42672 RepID=A0A8H5I7R4_9HYPO|nr:het-domain-containing protein [Fusarium napiforme]